MLRTIASGGNLVKRTGSLVKVARGTFIRSFSLECSKRKLHNPSPFRKNTLIPKQLQWHYQIRHYSSDLPSHIRVTLPALSPTMESGTIVSWEKKEGDKLNEGDLLAEIETDKATMGFETPEEGYLAKILVPAGSKGIPIGKLVCIIVENEADVAAFKDFKDDGAAASAPAPPSPAAAPPPPAAAAPKPPVQPTAVPPPPPPQDTGRVYASPMAKRLAEQRNIRLQGKGSGLYGSITSSDLDSVDAASAAAPLAPPPKPAPGATYVDIPLTNMRTVIAKRLLQSKQSVPHYFITMDVNVDRALQVRAKFNKRLEKDKVKLTINDFVLKATAMACRKVREANSAWMDTFIREYHNVDISVAVATEKGLITPIIFNADNKGLVEINTEMKALAQKARDGKLQPHEFQGGTISVSNLGMFGVAHFCAIINPPQSCILAIGGTQKRFVPADNEKGFDVASYMSVTLSSDHRVVDGAVGARWLQAFRDNMEDPEHMIL